MKTLTVGKLIADLPWQTRVFTAFIRCYSQIAYLSICSHF